jgi:uncharacterized protein (TIGR03083 family)
VDPQRHLAALEADSASVADLAAGHLDHRVPACPDWVVADLVGHLGGVYSFVSLVVAAAGARPDREREHPPEDRAQLLLWFRDQREAVLAALAAADPAQPAWVFFPPSPRQAAWWRRRQAMETAIHLADVRQATGEKPVIDAELASDGIDEMLTEMLPGLASRRPLDGLKGTLHVHCTDTPGGWLIDFSTAVPQVRREHAKGDTAARGPAAALYLWLWNRVGPDEAGIEVLGDRSLADAWRTVRL